MSNFDQRAAERWRRGVQKCRGGDPLLPFAGDPIEEAREECLDLSNYVLQAAADGRCSESLAMKIRALAIEADALLGGLE